MYRVSQNYHVRASRGEIPSVYVVIWGMQGSRIYSDKQLMGAFRSQNLLADGSAMANGLVNASGDICAIEISDRLISPGTLSKSIQPKTRDVINSLTNKEKQNVTIELNNYNYKLSREISTDPWLTRVLMIWSGFEADTLGEQILLFIGQISEIEVNKTSLILAVEEL